MPSRVAKIDLATAKTMRNLALVQPECQSACREHREHPGAWDNIPMPTPLDLVLSEQGQRLLQILGSTPPPLLDRLGMKLRDAGYDPDLVAAVLTQAHLRTQAREKLGPAASNMILTRPGLEQATRLAVAAHHAQRFRAAGFTRIADLGCGLGVDSLALAALGMSVVAIERDEDVARAARHNLRAFPEAKVICADVTEIDLADLGVEACFADPQRRSPTGRVLDPARWSPPLPRLLDLTAGLPVGIKVAPGIDHANLPEACHAQWTSVDGEVVEACLWTGELATPGVFRSALVIRDDRAHPFAVVDLPGANAPNPQVEAATDLGTYLFEPDGALLRAGAVAALAEALDARPVYRKVAYLTGETALPDELRPFLTAWRIVDVAPLGAKKLRARMRAWGAGEVTIKKRGVDVDPAALRRQILPRRFGEEPITLVCTRVGARHVALRVEPAD